MLCSGTASGDAARSKKKEKQEKKSKKEKKEKKSKLEKREKVSCYRFASATLSQAAANFVTVAAEGAQGAEAGTKTGEG